MPHNRLTFGEAEARAAAEAVASGQWAGGPRVQALERGLGGRAGRAHAVGVASGLAALRLGLKALGVARGDEVIVPAYSCVALANAAAGPRRLADRRGRRRRLEPRSAGGGRGPHEPHARGDRREHLRSARRRREPAPPRGPGDRGLCSRLRPRGGRRRARRTRRSRRAVLPRHQAAGRRRGRGGRDRSGRRRGGRPRLARLWRRAARRHAPERQAQRRPRGDRRSVSSSASTR